MKNILAFLLISLFAIPAHAGTSIWASTQRTTLTTIRIPVDTSSSSSPGHVRLTATTGQFLFDSAGTITGDTFGSGVVTFLETPTSANLATALTNETGTGAAVFGTSPTLTSPNELIPSTSKAGNYTWALSDLGSSIDFSSSGNVTGTIPPNSSVAYPIGTQLMWTMFGGGTLTIAPGAAVTLIKSGLTYASAGGYARKTGTNTWIVMGGL